MIALILQSVGVLAPGQSPAGYFAGAVMALVILGYLVYTLVKPDKF